jgi:N-acetylneuraminate lyase
MEKIKGLIAATHTPMNSDGSINTSVVPGYFKFLKNNNIQGIFLNGSTSEGYHLTTDERKIMAEVWNDAALGTDFKIFVFVGHLATKEACNLASHAAKLPQVHGISVTGPFYQKPSTPQLLVDLCAEVAAAAPDKPFYYYHIPVLTGIATPMSQFLKLAGAQIPNLAGVKYTHNDIEDFLLAQDVNNGKYDLLAGIDEIAIASRAVGAQGYIGSTYNFMAPLYLQLFDAFDKGDLAKAQSLQKLAIRIIQVIAPYGFISACKVIMQELGINNGVVRLPSRQITASEKVILLNDLKALNFFDYASKP